MDKSTKRLQIKTAYLSRFFAKFGTPNPAARKDPLEGIDIKAEMELIRKKESRLPANTRKLVEARYKLLEKEKKA